MSKIGEQIRELMEAQRVDNVYQLEEVRNGVGGGFGVHVSDGDSPRVHFSGDAPEITRLEDEGEMIHISAGDQGITLSPQQVETLHKLIEVMWRERNV